MNEKSFDKLLYLLKKSKDDFDKTIEKVAQKHGVTKAEADVLLFFANNPNLANAKDAVLSRGFSKSYVSQALKALEERGYISIQVEETDKRYQHIIINECALALISELQNVQKKHLLSLNKDIDPEDFKAFMKVMVQIVDNMLEGNEKNA